MKNYIVIIQDVSIKPVNTNYRIEIFYFPSEHKTYAGKFPQGIKGEFGPGIRSLIITLNHVANVSEPKIHEFLEILVFIYLKPLFLEVRSYRI